MSSIYESRGRFSELWDDAFEMAEVFRDWNPARRTYTVGWSVKAWGRGWAFDAVYSTFAPRRDIEIEAMKDRKVATKALARLATKREAHGLEAWK